MSPGINNYGLERIMRRSDWALFTNEQLGFLAALTAAAANRIIALPFPSGFNIELQTITTSKLSFDQHSPQPITKKNQMLAVYLSMLNKKFKADFVRLEDSEDEAMRAQFEGPMYFGHSRLANSFGATGEVANLGSHGHAQIRANWNPEVRSVRQLTPFYVQFQNASTVGIAAPQASPTVADYDLTEVEATTIREWFNVVPLTAAERGFRGDQLQWLRLNS